MTPRTSSSDLLRRVKTPSNDGFQTCTIPGCGRATEARQGNGLSTYLCRYHRQHRSRHGSPMKRSYTGKELKPYVLAAQSFIKAHKEDRDIVLSLRVIAGELSGAGPVRNVDDLRSLPLRQKARASLAMLREREVPPPRILAVTLGVLAAIKEDTYGPGGDRQLWTRVQIAKALRRRASGTHRVWENGWRLDRYPRSAGKVLEALGAIVERAAEFASYKHLNAVLALKQARYGVLPIPPFGTFAKSKFGNEKMPSPPPAVSLRAGNKRAQREAQAREEHESEKAAEETLRRFAEIGFEAFRGRF